MSQTVGLTVKDLSNEQVWKIIRETCAELIEQIDSNIVAVNDNGGSRAEFKLPKGFDVGGGISKADIQILIYSELLRRYTNPIDDPQVPGKGFPEVGIIVKNKGSPSEEHYFMTCWYNTLNIEDRAARREYVESHTIIEEPAPIRRRDTRQLYGYK